MKHYFNLTKLLKISSPFNKYFCHPARLAVSLRGFLLDKHFFILQFCRQIEYREFLTNLIYQLGQRRWKNKFQHPFFSFCGNHAAPKTDLGNTLISLTLFVLTCAKYPQKSHIISAHLKFLISGFRVPLLLHFKQEKFFSD